MSFVVKNIGKNVDIDASMEEVFEIITKILNNDFTEQDVKRLFEIIVYEQNWFNVKPNKIEVRDIENEGVTGEASKTSNKITIDTDTIQKTITDKTNGITASKEQIFNDLIFQLLNTLGHEMTHIQQYHAVAELNKTNKRSNKKYESIDKQSAYQLSKKLPYLTEDETKIIVSILDEIDKQHFSKKFIENLQNYLIKNIAGGNVELGKLIELNETIFKQTKGEFFQKLNAIKKENESYNAKQKEKIVKTIEYGAYADRAYERDARDGGLTFAHDFLITVAQHPNCPKELSEFILDNINSVTQNYNFDKKTIDKYGDKAVEKIRNYNFELFKKLETELVKASKPELKNQANQAFAGLNAEIYKKIIILNFSTIEPEGVIEAIKYAIENNLEFLAGELLTMYHQCYRGHESNQELDNYIIKSIQDGTFPENMLETDWFRCLSYEDKQIVVQYLAETNQLDKLDGSYQKIVDDITNSEKVDSEEATMVEEEKKQNPHPTTPQTEMEEDVEIEQLIRKKVQDRINNMYISYTHGQMNLINYEHNKDTMSEPQGDNFAYSDYEIDTLAQMLQHSINKGLHDINTIVALSICKLLVSPDNQQLIDDPTI